MKKSVLSICVLLFTFFAANAQNPEAKNPNAPEITFEKVVHDYGTIYQGSNGTCELKFSNTGKEPLILSKPRSSCGCTVPTWPKQPILPGNNDVIKITYNTRRVGIINKSVTIYSNAKNKSVVLKIKGKVAAKPKEALPEKTTDVDATPVNK